MYSSISKNKRNTVILLSSFVMIIAGIGLFFAYLYSDLSIFWVTFIGAMLYAWIDYIFSSKIVLSMAGAQEVTRQQAPEFYAAVETITLTTGLPMPKLYIINDPAPNAFAAGTKPENAVICATTGLLQIMNKSELEAVVAHEAGHIKNYDIRISMAAVALTAAIGLIADIAVRIFLYDDDDHGKNPISMMVGLIASIIMPILAIIIRMAISRQREFLADATAVMITRYPEGLISALEKLRDYGAPLQRQNSTTANLYISNPMKSSFFSRIFATHPPIEARINRLKENSAKF